MRWVLTVVLMLPADAWAGGCRYVEEKIVVREVVAASFVTIPLYSVASLYPPPSYFPPPVVAPVAPVMPPADDCKARTANLERELATLKQQIAVLTGSQPTPPVPFPIPGPKAEAPTGGESRYGAGLAVMLIKCSACHEKKFAAAKSKGLTLFDGDQPTKWNATTQLKIVLQVHTGRMPPPSTKVNLTDQEASEVVAFIDSLAK